MNEWKRTILQHYELDGMCGVSCMTGRCGPTCRNPECRVKVTRHNAAASARVNLLWHWREQRELGLGPFSWARREP